MIDRDKLASLLNQPGVQSDVLLGQALGVSADAIQEYIQTLIAVGLPIIVSPDQGYRLEPGVRLLDADAIASEIISDNPDYQGCFSSLEVKQSLPSTNDHLLSQEFEYAKMRVCATEVQLAGRGRRGNDWQSSPYRNIMLSVSWSFSNWPETITGLGLAVAQTVAELLNAQALNNPTQNSLDVKIKWPNDLMVCDDKLGGILIDVSGEASGNCNVVIGLGLNVHQPDWSQSNSDYRWCDLKSHDLAVDRNVLIARIVSAWLAMLKEFEITGFKPLAQRWNKLSSHAGKAIRVGEHDNHIQGKMVGVDTVGALLLEDDDGKIHRFSDSNVSVRLI